MSDLIGLVTSRMSTIFMRGTPGRRDRDCGHAGLRAGGHAGSPEGSNAGAARPKAAEFRGREPRYRPVAVFPDETAGPVAPRAVDMVSYPSGASGHVVGLRPF